MSCLIILLNIQRIESAFYVPGVAAKSWAEGESISLNVNKITSVKTLLPYEYYYLPFCSPEKRQEQQENLGEIMSGDAIQESLYHLKMQEDVKCQILCAPVTYGQDQMSEFIDKIENDYFVDWVVDNLPVLYKDPHGMEYKRGYPMGGYDALKQQYFLYNHVRIIILTSRDEPDDAGLAANVKPTDERPEGTRWRIVGFEVIPSSIAHKYDKASAQGGTELASDTCGKIADVETLSMNHHQYLVDKTDKTSSVSILFTYDVQFIESPDIEWEHRWDRIISSRTINDQIHWFSILNSIMIALFLTGMIALIMLRTLHREIAEYNQISTSEEAQEESGWKLVHGDVFRPPTTSPTLFSVFVGTGVQVCMMAAITMAVALLGLLSPANRGSLLTTLLLLFVFMGSFAGYFASRTYKMFRGKDWKRTTLLTAFCYPGVLFSIFFFLNLFLWSEASSQAVPFGTLFALLVLWFGISVPLVFVGAYFGFKQPPVEFPTRTNQIARQIPVQVWYLRPPASFLLCGILPFGAVFIELFFIMSALWLHQIYYVFGFLFLVLLILGLTCAEVTIVMCYFQLCAEDHEWWWRSFLHSGSAAMYLWGYSFFYYYTKLNITAFVSTLLYFGFMTMISITFFFLTGTVGYFACLWFTRKIYGSIKVD